MPNRKEDVSLVIDARMYFSSGIGTVLQNLIPRFAKEGFALTLLLQEKDLEKINLPFSVNTISMQSSIYSGQEQLELAKKIPPSDLFWSPHYNIPLLPIKAKRRIVTIHDVCHVAQKEYFSLLQRLYAKRMLKFALSRSDLVFVNSEFTLKEIKSHIQKKVGNLQVVPWSVDSEQFSAVTSELDQEAKNLYNLPKSYFLFVGNLKPHKNLSLLLDAFENVADKITSDLVIVGASSHFIVSDEDAIVKAKKSRFANRVRFLGRVDQKYLSSIYHLAKALVFPSFYEGFGLPALEAMQCATPVLASKIGALEEVCGDAALYFDPYHSQSLEALMILLEQNELVRMALLQKGKRHLLRYDWDKSALEYTKQMKNLVAK